MERYVKDVRANKLWLADENGSNRSIYALAKRKRNTYYVFLDSLIGEEIQEERNGAYRLFELQCIHSPVEAFVCMMASDDKKLESIFRRICGDYLSREVITRIKERMNGEDTIVDTGFVPDVVKILQSEGVTPLRLFYLLDGEQQAQEKPDTFVVPCHKEIAALKKNDFVELAFIEESMREHLWVRIEKVVIRYDDLLFVGNLEEASAHNKLLQQGVEIFFRQKHILDVIPGKLVRTKST